jgi:hypothetical protein
VGTVIKVADWGLAVQGEAPLMKKKRADAIVNNHFSNRETLSEQSYDLEALSMSVIPSRFVGLSSASPVAGA